MSNYEELAQFIEEQDGISREEAEHAIRRCAAAMASQGLVYGVAGAAIVGFLTKNPIAALGSGVVAGAGGAVLAPFNAPQCSEIRDAIRHWNSAKF
jgi:hypothetical protein